MKLRGAVIQPYLFGFWLGGCDPFWWHMFSRQKKLDWFQIYLKRNSGAIHYAFMRSDCQLGTLMCNLCGLMWWHVDGRKASTSKYRVFFVKMTWAGAISRLWDNLHFHGFFYLQVYMRQYHHWAIFWKQFRRLRNSHVVSLYLLGWYDTFCWWFFLGYGGHSHL